MEIPQLKLSRFLFTDNRFSWVWLIVRLYIGYEWVLAGWEKLGNSAWVGSKAGSAITVFLINALQKASGKYPDVSFWYAYLIKYIALPHPILLSYLVAYGEMIVGIALIVGFFTGIAAFFGGMMNLNYLFAGTLSINPQMLILQVFLVLAWRTAGWLGLDRYVLPRVYPSWKAGALFYGKDSKLT